MTELKDDLLIDPGLEAYKKGIYILLAFKEGYRWYNFTDCLINQSIQASHNAHIFVIIDLISELSWI